MPALATTPLSPNSKKPFAPTGGASGKYGQNGLRRFRNLCLSLWYENLVHKHNKDAPQTHLKCQQRWHIDSDHFKLTDYAKDELLSELNLQSARNGSHHLTKHESLTAKTLIYNSKEKEQISQLTELLMPERFTAIQKNLEQAGMRHGFCCLFYGAPRRSD